MIEVVNPVQDCKDFSMFSWTKQGGVKPIHAVKAEGCYIYDSDGKSYLDFSSQLMNVNIGHGHPKVLEAINEQMKDICYVYPGMATDIRAKVSKQLARLAPGSLKKTFFTLGGAEATENAIKLARVYTGKHKILAQYRSYHGGTMGAMSVSGDPRRHDVDAQQMPNVVHFENPYFYRCPWGTSSMEECGEMAFRNLEQIVKYENPNTIAAIILEGESGSSGCIKYPKGYWKKIRALCDRHGILLIDDEVMSGFGRTGKMFAVEHHEVVPDIICMAKGLTSGYLPLGGIIIKEEIAKYFDDHYFPIGLTYSAHPACMAAASAVLDVYEEEKLIERAAEMGKYVEAKAEEMKLKHPSIGDFRNTGLLGCFELVKNRETKEPVTPWNAGPDEMEVTARMATKVRELGMFTFVRWNWVFVAPPLNITKEQIDEGMEIISEVIAIADEYCN